MKLAHIHSWNLSPREAVALQKQLAAEVRIQKPVQPIRLIAGVDCAPSRDKQVYCAAIVLWDLCTRQVLEAHCAKVPLTFPYIPGLLSFRELPAVLAAIKYLNQMPDVFMVDGHGIAHPRKFGIATHLGVLLNRPSFGCGKSRLYGDYEAPGLLRGATSPLIGKNGELLGQVLRTRTRVKPVIVSVGHLIDLETAVQLVLSSSAGYRLPEPTRLADRWVHQYKLENFINKQNESNSAGKK